jgi:hypothetical protein
LNGEKTNVSRTISVLVLRVLKLIMVAVRDCMTENLKTQNSHSVYINPWSTALENLRAAYLAKKLPAIYGNQIVHYCVHKIPPPIPILSHINPVQNNVILKIYFNIILQSWPRSPKKTLRFGFS